MTRRAIVGVLLFAAVAAAGCHYGKSSSQAGTVAAANPRSGGAPSQSCVAPVVHYTPAPGARQMDLSGIPWIRGEPQDSGLVALLWYWPRTWTKQHVAEGRIFTGGVAPAGYNVKVLWMFLSPHARQRSARDLVVTGDRLDGTGGFTERFSVIGDEADQTAPAYASIIDVPSPGCWRLSLTTGRLKASIDVRAVPTRGGAVSS